MPDFKAVRRMVSTGPAEDKFFEEMKMALSTVSYCNPSVKMQESVALMAKLIGLMVKDAPEPIKENVRSMVIANIDHAMGKDTGVRVYGRGSGQTN